MSFLLLKMNLMLNKFFFRPNLVSSLPFLPFDSVCFPLRRVSWCLFLHLFPDKIVSREKQNGNLSQNGLNQKTKIHFQQFLKRILKFYQESQSQVELYRHQIALTQDEINNLHKETYSIDLNLNKMFPLSPPILPTQTSPQLLH